MIPIDDLLERIKTPPLSEPEEILGDMERYRTLVPGPSNRQQAEAICQYFDCPYGFPQEHGREFFWDTLADIRATVCHQLHLRTGEEWHLDWSRADHAFCLWRRHRDSRLDATRDLSFVRSYTVALLSPVEIRESAEHGFGLYATEDITKDQDLGVLDGQRMSVLEYDRLYHTLGHSLGRLRPYFFMEWNALDENTVLARAYRTNYSYINHATDPNLLLVRAPNSCMIIVRAINNIPKDFELFLDYRKEPLPKGYFEGRGAAYLHPRPILF